MSKIPCRKCPDCGLINDITAQECVCGEDISYIPQAIYETDDIEAAQKGIINDALEYYVQKCPMCGKPNYTADKNSPVKRCFSCAKAKISSVEPILCEDNTAKAKAIEKEEPKEEKTEPVKAAEEPKEEKTEPVKAAEEPKEEKTEPVNAAEEPKEEKTEPVKAAEELKEEKTEPVKAAEEPKEEKAEPVKAAEKPKEVQAEPVDMTGELFELNDEFGADKAEQIVEINEKTASAKEEDVFVINEPVTEPDKKDWSFRLSDMDDFDLTDSTEKSIILTAVRYGVFSFTVTPDMVREKPYMLGRSAGQHEFLSKDPRVGNFHCTLFCNNGQWYVQDNNSTNGTFVDDTDLGEGGCTDLQEGDRIKLGHSMDSMEFKVSFGQ